MLFLLIVLLAVAAVVVVLQVKHNAKLLSVESKLEDYAVKLENWVKTKF